jgi:putative endonuclease
MDRSSRARGRWGEERAVAHLRRLGFTIVDRNWRSPEREVPGELDIVAIDGESDLVVFCEVKARRRGGHGGAVAAVGVVKQRRIRVLAESWLRCRDHVAAAVRFDVITIDGVVLRHWDAAF